MINGIINNYNDLFRFTSDANLLDELSKLLRILGILSFFPVFNYMKINYGLVLFGIEIFIEVVEMYAIFVVQIDLIACHNERIVSVLADNPQRRTNFFAMVFFL